MTLYPDTQVLREARDEYFRRHGLGEDGGYGSRWVRFRIGPIRLPIPNTRARVRALPLHDLHHIATGYDASWTGEAEIAAWELGGGCGRYAAAWLLNFAAVSIGSVLAPRRVWRAFQRGRVSTTLYGEPWDPAWLGRTVGALRERLALGTVITPPRLPPQSSVRSPAGLLGASVVLAWLGMYVHNRADLPGLTFWSPENVGPAAVWVLCFSFRLGFVRHRWAAGPLAAWGLLNLVGGFLSVLPMPFWPYVPEQSLRHYGFHVLYAAAQVPLLVMARAELRRARRVP